MFVIDFSRTGFVFNDFAMFILYATVNYIKHVSGKQSSNYVLMRNIIKSNSVNICQSPDKFRDNTSKPATTVWFVM
jgi:hypothetical protein